MANDVEEELKKLSPQERINRLKDIQKKREEEIKKAQEMIKTSEAEIEEEEKSKRQMPIPQLKSVDVSSLFGKGTQEEQMFAAKRFRAIRQGREEAEEEVPLEEALAPEEQEALEARIVEESERLREEAEQSALYQAGMARQERQYQVNLARELAEAPSKDIYNAVKAAYEEAKETGYVSSEQMKLVNAASQAALTRMDAMVSGDYQQSKQATDSLVASARMAKAMKDQYKR
ncbi:hypothetical protein KY361_06015 [Candidatus Woesearchaeota archaeon]|nr:hypothetical protein [Candidatus Woesearchaeota archaeon]